MAMVMMSNDLDFLIKGLSEFSARPKSAARIRKCVASLWKRKLSRSSTC